ncbi:uncharacterized protein LACBIDRAFT_319040 [Laccaria bicolor S238N-H82]|uniref:Predicted protein n=1 Tax=Laccaria bicolor (strain S238N-H82 / ATCC MYA-4686) TaxID=486041 RepID=B0D7Q5_LACBS|nr:uncharacterized protein LACBIDRAFT_319040 [Laccaria bicolor S238N-H82]EDR09440.1 predicted protein [Laccaria bicolor S238N-H82]|eukprot:XP_001879789.1 predicted protein [Laccaria bicolor S238N-H82]
MPTLRREALLDYQLPSTVQSLQGGWQLTCQSGTMVSTLFVIAATQLLAFFKNPNHFSTTQNNSEGALRALIIICYASLFFNASAAISSFILMDKLGELPFRAASKRQSILPSGGTITGNSEDLLKRYGVGKLWTVLVWHWFVSYMIGTISIITQVLLYVWLQESKEAQIVLSCIAGFSFLPLAVLFTP